MSSLQDIDANVVSTLILKNYTQISASALWAYDFLLTIDAEIAQIWASRTTLPSALYLLNRYTFIAVAVLQTAECFLQTPSNRFCQRWIMASQIISLLSMGFAMSILAWRTIALYEKALWVVSVLLVVGLAKMLFNCLRNFAYAHSAQTLEPIFTGCAVMTFTKLDDRLDIGQRFLTLAFDTLVFVLTVAKTLRNVLENRRLGMPRGLRFALLRDGTLYYLPILCLTLAQTLPILIKKDSLADEVISPFAFSLQNILVNRLVLSLRQTANQNWFLDDSVLAQPDPDITQDEILSRMPRLHIEGPPEAGPSESV